MEEATNLRIKEGRMEKIEQLMKQYEMKGFKRLRRKIASLRLRMKRGILLDSFITLRCNYNCHYCPFLIKGWKYENKEKPFEDWVHYINNNIPYPIKRMAIMGGEPSLIKWVGAYVNFLTNPIPIHKKSGIMGVTIYTNFHDISNFLIIVPSPYLRFNVTYHEKYTDYDKFVKNLERMLKAGHNIKLSKIADNEDEVDVVTGTGLMREADYQMQCCRFRLAPDLTIHARAWDIARYLKK